MESYICAVLACFTLMLLSADVQGHGRLLKPPSRASAWRFGYNTPSNYDDNQLFCGGRDRQIKNGGKCGVCGDPFDGQREHEAGGKYATGTITGRYSQGQTIDVNVQITATHKGYFEFRLCPHNSARTPVTQSCLDRYVLRQPNGNTRVHELGHIANYTIKLVLPSDVSCSQCVLQWKYNTGNSWGCEGKHCCLGCGQQEQFYGCSDISIGHQSGYNHQTIGSNGQTGGHSSLSSGNTGVVSSEQSHQPGYTHQNTLSNTFGLHSSISQQHQQGIFLHPSHTQSQGSGHSVHIPVNNGHLVQTGQGVVALCRATDYYRSIYRFADQYCVVQCRSRNCPSSKYCTAACTYL